MDVTNTGDVAEVRIVENILLTPEENILQQI